MKKLIIILLVSMISNNSFGQSIEEIETDLSSFPDKITYIPKIDKARVLLERDHFNYIAIRYILDYYKETKIDSISLFLDNLIQANKEKVEPLILRTEFLHYEKNFSENETYNKLKVFYLDSAYRVDNQSKKVLFLLSEVYYRDFINSIKKEDEKSEFEHSADSALGYFYKLWQNDSDIIKIIFYPIKQLECYLNKLSNSQIQLNTERDFNQCYFPTWYFANLKTNWQCDKSIDYLFAIQKSARSANWLKIQLEDLKEPCLYNLETVDEAKIIRFTWLRSFHHPISIRLQKKNDKIVLIWKEGKGAGGYSPRGLKRTGKKIINSKNWNKISTLISNVKLDSLENEKYIPMTDGASWTLERNDKNGYKAHKTNEPTKEFRELAISLIKLTRLKVKEEDIY